MMIGPHRRRHPDALWIPVAGALVYVGPVLLQEYRGRPGCGGWDG